MTGQLLIDAIVYGFDIWPGHPCEREVYDLLRSFRERCGELRTRVEEHNRQAGLPTEFSEVVSCVGQCVLQRETDSENDHAED